MNTPALSTMDTLFAVYQNHKRDLPEPISVQLHARYNCRDIDVHIGEYGDPTTETRHLLAWAQSLDAVDVEWWHTDGDDLHIAIHGLAGVDTRMLVYGAVPYDDCRDVVQLDPGQRDSVSVDALGALADHLAEAVTQ